MTFSKNRALKQGPFLFGLKFYNPLGKIMPKLEMDWDQIEEVPVGPEVMFSAEIEAEIKRMEFVISEANAQLHRRKKDSRESAHKLVSFASNQDPEDYYVRYMAFMDVLSRRGLLDNYYDPDYTQDTRLGWEIIINAKNTMGGSFKVSYAKNSTTEIGRQTVHYFPNR